MNQVHNMSSRSSSVNLFDSEPGFYFTHNESFNVKLIRYWCSFRGAKDQTKNVFNAAGFTRESIRDQPIIIKKYYCASNLIVTVYFKGTHLLRGKFLKT